MRNDDPHSRIEELRSLGMSPQTMLARLALEGFAPHDVLDALRTPAAGAPISPTDARPAEVPTPAVAIPRATPRRRVSVQGALLAVAALVAVAFAGTSAYLYLRPAYVYSITIPNATTSAPALTYGALPALSDPDYYANVKATLMRERASFIDADLSNMRLTVYVSGTSTLEVPILAKGKVGSWWETPAGIYQIQTKETNHLSSIGDVYMPYSMQFQGNFFIHGWPYYPDGTPVATTFSGGCIRLSTDDAEKVFNLTRTGIPVVVYNAPSDPSPFDYQLKAPSISAQEYLVADLDTGTVLLSKNASSTAAIASVTKLVTALVATEYINLDKEVEVPQSAIVYTTVPRLRPGTQVRVYDLLFLLLQESSNEAAETLAAAVGRDQFVKYMNDKAHAIGLENTVFSDPSGAKDDISSPIDLFKLLRYISANRRFVFEITTGETTDSAYGKPAFAGISNFNPIKNVTTTLLGGKIGETNQAGETYAGVFSVQIGSATRPIAVIVLGSNDSQSDVAKLLTFIRSSYMPQSGIYSVSQPSI